MAAPKQYTNKDGSKSWMFQIYIGLDPITEKKKYTTRRGFKSRKEANLAQAELQLELEKVLSDAEEAELKRLEEARAKTFVEIYELWIDQHRHTVREVTADRIEDQFRLHILPIFEDERILEVDTLFCQNAVSKWAGYYSHFKALKSYAQKVFQFAINMQLITTNPMQHVIMPRKKEKVDDDDQFENYYDLKELQHFFKCLEKENVKKDLAISRVLAFTGIRKGELAALTWEDINFEEKTLRISKSLTYVKAVPKITPPKNKKSKRVLPIDDRTIEILKQWRVTQATELLQLGLNVNNDPTQIVFTHPSKGELNHYLSRDYINHFLKMIIAKYDLGYITPHGFRHTHASLLFESEASIKEVQERLGHANAQITLDIYTHVTKTARVETAENFARYANF